MKNGTKSNLWFPRPNPGKGKRGGRSSWTAAPWSTPSFMWIEPAAPGGYLPKEFGPWQTVYGYFRQWSQDWTWTFIHDTCATGCATPKAAKVAPTAAIIDSQSVKTPDQAGERGYDAGKKIKGRKRHVAVDTLGLVLAMMITSAAVQDRDAAKNLIGALGQDVWPAANHLGRWRLLGSIGPVGQTTAALWQAAPGNRAAV